MTFDLDLRVKVTQNVAQYPLHHVTCSATKFEVATFYGLGGEAFTRKTLFDLDLGVKVTQNVAQYPLHHVSYSATKFEVATSNRLGGDTFTRNVMDAHPHGRTDARTLRRTDRRTTDQLWYEINIPFFPKKKAGIMTKLVNFIFHIMKYPIFDIN